MRLNRAMGELEKVNGNARQAVVMADGATKGGNTAKAVEYTQAAEAFANRPVQPPSAKRSFSTWRPDCRCRTPRFVLGPQPSRALPPETPVHEALSSLHYVHFARFLPSIDGSLLWVITEYDGGLESYIMDFVGVLGDEFTAILQFIAGAPPLPVQRYAREFTDYITKQNLGQVGVWSAYPEVTVIDILRGARRL